MDLNKVKDSNISLLKSIDQDDYELYCDRITLNFIELIKNKNFKNILFIQNALFEPRINDMIKYCLTNGINCYLNYYTKTRIIKYIKVNSSEYPKEYYSYTIQPTLDPHTKFSTNINFDLVVHPVMIFDNQKNCVDYMHDLTYVSLIKLDSKVKRCAYAFSIQEYSSISNENKGFSANYIITNDHIYE